MIDQTCSDQASGLRYMSLMKKIWILCLMLLLIQNCGYKPIYSKNQKINFRNISLLASAGIKFLDVYKLLKIGVVSNGNELVPLNKIKNNFQIFDSNKLQILNFLNLFVKLSKKPFSPKNPLLFIDLLFLSSLRTLSTCLSNLYEAPNEE